MNTQNSHSVREDSNDPQYTRFQEWFNSQENVRGEQVSIVAWNAWKYSRGEALVEAFEKLKIL